MANTVFKLRRSSVAGKVPTTTDIAIGEMALNLTDRLLYSSDGTNTWEIGSNNSTVRVSNSITVATNSIINSSGIFTTQTINAASYTIGATFVANTITLNANGLIVNSTGAYVTGLTNSTSFNVGTSTVSNATGVWTTGQVNAASHTTGGGGGSATGGVTVNTTVITIGNSTVNSTANSMSINPDVGMSNKQTLDHDYSLSSGRNLVIGGPFTISTGYTMTIPTGSRLVVI